MLTSLHQQTPPGSSIQFHQLLRATRPSLVPPDDKTDRPVKGCSHRSGKERWIGHRDTSPRTYSRTNSKPYVESQPEPPQLRPEARTNSDSTPMDFARQRLHLI